MLYTTTRAKHDVVTAHKTIHTDCYIDGGLFVPFRMPRLDRGQIEAMGAISAAQTIANVLNAFFPCALTAWDVELAVGRRPVQLATIGRQIVAGELWHNAQGSVDALVQALSDRLGGHPGEDPTNWVKVAVRIALIFASFTTLLSSGTFRGMTKLDIAVPTEDFSLPMAVWYARSMGLPIGNIICGSNANGAFWDLLNRGELATGDQSVPTWTPDANYVAARDLERLIYGVLGIDENRRYLKACGEGKNYMLLPDQLEQLGQGLFAAVISDSRVASIIPGVYRTRSYILSPYAALAYGSIQDFRATTGEENPTLLIADRSPVNDGALVSRLLKIKELDLKKRLSK